MLERYKTAACSSEAISLSIRYGILLALSEFCFPKTNPNIQRFRSLLSFCLGISYIEFIINAFGSRLTSVGQLQKYAARAKLFLANEAFCVYTLLRLQIIQIAVENQCKKKARGNPLRILNLPFEHKTQRIVVMCEWKILDAQ